MNCLYCQYFDPLHFECNDARQGLMLEEVDPDEALKENPCSTNNKNHELDYWKQRATNAEAFIRDVMVFAHQEKARNMLPSKIMQ